MAEYRVIHTFVDLCDKHHVYRTGDPFPRSGSDVSADRIAELASAKNKMRLPVIEVVQGAKPAEVVAVAPGTDEESESTTNPASEQPKKKGRKKKDAV